MFFQAVSFESGGLKCVGWLFSAPGARSRPCVILAHGFCGIKEARLDAYAAEFADSGYHALIFDYRHFGGSAGSPRQILDIKKQQQDWHAAIAYARTLPDIDPDRIVLWGTSFSGGHVVDVAANDPRVAAVISQVPHMSGVATAMAAGPVQGFRLGMAAVYDTVRAFAGASPYYIPAFGRPGELAAMTAPGEFEASRKLFPQDVPVDESVAARVFLAVPFFNPARRARCLRVPWLVQVAGGDRTTPAKAAIRAAQKTHRAELITYPLGHFDVYVAPHFEQTVRDQVEFLHRHLR